MAYLSLFLGVYYSTLFDFLFLSYEGYFKSKVTLFTKLVKKIELRNNVYWIPHKISYFSTQSLSSLKQLNSFLEQRPMLHFLKMGFLAGWDPSSCTHATMWFLIPKRVCRGCYNIILSLPNIEKNDVSHL